MVVGRNNVAVVCGCLRPGALRRSVLTLCRPPGYCPGAFVRYPNTKIRFLIRFLPEKRNSCSPLPLRSVSLRLPCGIYPEKSRSPALSGKRRTAVRLRKMSVCPAIPAVRSAGSAARRRVPLRERAGRGLEDAEAGMALRSAARREWIAWMYDGNTLLFRRPSSVSRPKNAGNARRLDSRVRGGRE